MPLFYKLAVYSLNNRIFMGGDNYFLGIKDSISKIPPIWSLEARTRSIRSISIKYICLVEAQQ